MRRALLLVFGVVCFVTALALCIWSIVMLVRDPASIASLDWVFFALIGATVHLGRASFRRAFELLLRREDRDPMPYERKWRKSSGNRAFWIGHIITLTSIGLTLLALLFAGKSGSLSGVPMGIGIGVAMLFYLSGTIRGLIEVFGTDEREPS